jgi:hypothetical protein
MSASALVALTPATKPFILRIGGGVYTASNPVGDESCTISESSDGSPNQMTFTLEDITNSISFDFGEVTELVDRRSGNERLLFGGHLIETRSVRRQNGQGRLLVCTAMGYDAWLDWRIVPAWTSKTDRNGRVSRIFSDRTMVQQLVNRFGGDLIAPDSTVAATNNEMEILHIAKATLREAIERVGESAMFDDAESNRHVYVDNAKRVHYYRGSESLTAPYRISDGIYTRDVLTSTNEGVVSLWPMREASGTTCYDAKGYANGTLAGGYTQNVAGLIPNEPAMRATTLNGSTGYMSATGANLHPGDTFTIGFVVKRSALGTAQTVWSGGTDDVEIGFNASNNLIIIKEGLGNHFVSNAEYTDTDEAIHVMVAREPGNTDVYVNGAEISGTTTARTFVAGSGTINIGRRKSGTDRHFSGTIQHVFVSDGEMDTADALALYNQAVSIVPEEWEVTKSAFSGREAVYVSGANKNGTGWVRNPSILRTAFGVSGRQPERQEVMERDDSEGPGKRRSYGRWFLKRNNDPEIGGRFTVMDFDGWRVGQTVYLTSTPDSLDGYAAEIKEIDTDVGFGSGVLTYDIVWGKKRWSGARAVARRNRRG